MWETKKCNLSYWHCTSHIAYMANSCNFFSAMNNKVFMHQSFYISRNIIFRSLFFPSPRSMSCTCRYFFCHLTDFIVLRNKTIADDDDGGMEWRKLWNQNYKFNFDDILKLFFTPSLCSIECLFHHDVIEKLFTLYSLRDICECNDI